MAQNGVQNHSKVLSLMDSLRDPLPQRELVEANLWVCVFETVFPTENNSNFLGTRNVLEVEQRSALVTKISG